MMSEGPFDWSKTPSDLLFGASSAAAGAYTEIAFDVFTGADIGPSAVSWMAAGIAIGLKRILYDRVVEAADERKKARSEERVKDQLAEAIDQNLDLCARINREHPDLRYQRLIIDMRADLKLTRELKEFKELLVQSRVLRDEMIDEFGEPDA